MAPIVHGFEDRYGERIDFVYLDIDDPNNDVFKQLLGYRYQPHIYILNESGEVLKQWVGRVSEEELALNFKQVLGE